MRDEESKYMLMLNRDKLVCPRYNEKDYNLWRPNILGTKYRAKYATKKNNKKVQELKSSLCSQQNMFSYSNNKKMMQQ